MGVKNYNRKRRLLDALHEHSPRPVKELAELLGVSLPTIRRDLAELDEQGLIARDHGMIAIRGISAETIHVQREKHNLDLKKQIAKHVAAGIPEGSIIALDIGTTCVEIAKELVHRSNLTVFTSSVQAASVLARSNLSVYLIGGYLRNSEMSAIGSIAVETIMKFKFDRFYLNLAGISNEDGPTDYNLEETEVKKAFISRSREVIAVVDKTKIGKSALVKVCELDDIAEIVTNAHDMQPYPIQFGGKLTLV